MIGDRYVVVGLAKVRSPWFADVARWANSSRLPIEFLKCVGPAEARGRLASSRPASAIVVDAGVAGLDRDLVDEARTNSAAVIVVEDRRVERDWLALGVHAVLPETFDAETLMACLEAHAQPIRSTTDPTVPDRTDSIDAPSGWRGRLVAVTGGSGAGTSTVAMAVAQGLALQPGNAGAVVLADLAGCGDQAMYHDVRDVMPGLQELVESHRTTTPSRESVRQLLFDIDDRAYSLLLGLRRSRDWTALRPRALDAAIESLRAAFRIVVADIGHEFDGEDETGSVDIEDRNHASRAAVVGADVVAVCGDASLKGLHSLVRTERDVLALGVDPASLVRVVNRAPRSPRHRAEIARSLNDLAAVAGHRLGPVFLPDRRQLDLTHTVARPLPTALVAPITRAVVELAASPR